MPSFDGIRRGTAPTPTPRYQPPAPQVRLRGPATPRNAGFLVGLLVLVAVFAFLRPTSEASSLPKSTNQQVVTPTHSETTLPPLLQHPPSQASEGALDSLVILDTPTESSQPQPEELSDNATTTDESNADTKPSKEDAATNTARDFTIRILNGSGKSGAAAALRNQLTAKSLTVSSIGNAQQTYDVTTVYYQPGQRTAAEQILKELGAPAATLEENAIAKPAEVLIVIGTDRK